MDIEQPQPQDKQQTGYTRAQFEHAFRSMTQMCHAVAYLDMKEIQRWVMLVASAEETGMDLTQAQIEGRARVIQLLENLDTFKDTLRVTGIPPVPELQVDPNQQPPTPNSAVPSARPQ